jgi:hypothetical protein
MNFMAINDITKRLPYILVNGELPFSVTGWSNNIIIERFYKLYMFLCLFLESVNISV